MPPRPENVCQWVDQKIALATFATYKGATQSQAHIKPLHWYVACRLVVEGGFRPRDYAASSIPRKAHGWRMANRLRSRRCRRWRTHTARRPQNEKR